MSKNVIRFRPLANLWRALVLLMAVGMVRAPAGNAQSNDPPHDGSQGMICGSCHLVPHSGDASISNVVGNANLCLSCHMPGGMASRYALADSDQALTGPCLPTNVAASGTSHRWDSGLAGHADYMGGAQTNSSGLVIPLGDYTGRVAKTYVITIVTNGQVGTAKFTWSGWLGMGSTGPIAGGGGASNVVTAAAVALDQGISVSFSNGTVNPSFRVGDQWNLYVRADISLPTNALLLSHVTNGLLACSTCHNQHSQSNTPFDVNAPLTPGVAGRHFQRINNNSDQLCVECHAARNVSNIASGSHPVGVLIPTRGFFKTPSTNLPLERVTNKVRCLTCHDVHNSGSSDGSLLRKMDRNALCTECHTQADTNQCAHLTLATAKAWPGGQYGSTFPAETDSSQRGMCNDCHQPHGWPDSSNPGFDYTNLLVEAEEKLCFTCHDGSPASSTNSVMNDFTNATKIIRHPVANTDPLRRNGRTVECTDCHNPHRAQIGRSVYTNTIPMTATRNLVQNPSIGASGVAVSYAGLTNFVAPGTNAYTFLTNNVAYEYQICFKCHSAYYWGTNSPPNGLSGNGGSVTNPVETDLAQGFSPMNRSGHPVITGLDNYTNSFVVGGKKGLLAAALKAPWTNNVGSQTMLCTDCHNTDGTAAQGPHGSAAQFMLRGPNSANWPNVTLNNYGTSWCANCHPTGANNVHQDTGNHGSRQCYLCHIVIPHGGKVSRLIADHNAMPLRYAYSNAWNSSGILSFTKTTATGYQKSNCEAGCANATGDPHAGAATENW